MPEYITKEISAGVRFTYVIDERFKTDTLRLRMYDTLTEDKAALNAIIPKILTNSSSEYPDIKSISRKLSDLYGASVTGSAGAFQGLQVVSMNCTTIDNKFTINGEDAVGELIDLYFGCMLDPVVKDGAFDEKEFSLRRQELIDDIESEINDKRTYANNQAQKLVYENEARAVNPIGTVENAEKMTSAEAYARYKELLRTARLEFVYVGNSLDEALKNRIFGYIESIDRDYKEISPEGFSAVKQTAVRKTEKMDVVQSKLIMAYKSSMTDEYKLTLFSVMLGGTPFSLLFDNVREKLSLCYYCQSAYSKKNVLIIDSGVQHENVSSAEKAIAEQIELMKNGSFTDEKMEQTKMYIANSYGSVNDSPRAISDWYYRFVFEEKPLSPNEVMEKINAVTRDDVIAAANSLSEDSVYLLTGKETV